MKTYTVTIHRGDGLMDSYFIATYSLQSAKAIAQFHKRKNGTKGRIQVKLTNDLNH